MKCPTCGSTKDKCVDSRPVQRDTATRRRRSCLVCGRRWTTYEVPGNQIDRMVRSVNRVKTRINAALKEFKAMSDLDMFTPEHLQEELPAASDLTHIVPPVEAEVNP